MVRVPEYQPGIELRPALRQDLAPNATPQAFGSDVGTGMENLARGGMQAAHSLAAVQEIENEAVARDARNAFVAEKDQLLYGDSGYATLQGKDALDGFDQFGNKLAQARRNASSKLTPPQQAIFARSADTIETDAKRSAITHRASSLKHFVVSTATNSADAFKQQAISHYGDPKQWSKYVNAGLHQLDDLGGKLGWSPAELKQKQADYLSDAHRTTALTLSQDDPIAAAEYITKHRSNLTPADYLTTMRDLMRGTSEAVTRDAVTTRAGNRSRAQFAAAGLPPEAYQLLGVISGTESPDYRTKNGGEKFSGFADHPRSVGAGGKSTAAGRYQMVRGTWDRVQQALNLPDFGPASQDVGAWWLAAQDFKTRTGRDLVADIRAGNFAQIKAGLGDTWQGIAKLSDDKFAERMKAAGGKSPTIAPQYSERVSGLLDTLPAHYAARLREAADTGVSAAETEFATRIKAQRVAAADEYKLRIAQDDLTLTRQEILDNPSLDNGDRASLITSLKSRQGEIIETQKAISDFQAGNLTVDPYSDSGKKVVDRVWSTIATKIEPKQRLAMVEEVTRQAGVVPTPVVHAVRSDLVSDQVATVANAANLASRLRAINPAALERQPGGKDILDAAVAFDHLTKTVGLDPHVAAKRLIDARDPTKVKERAALMTSEPVKDFIEKQATESNVRNVFDRGLFHLDPKLGETPATSAAMVDEFKGILKESLFDAAGDQDLATKMASERFRRRYAVSDFTIAGPSVVARFPVEITYPADASGSRDYVRTQAKAALSSAGVTSDRVFLQPYEATEQDVSAGRPARYQVFYTTKDGTVERYHLPFFATRPTKEEIAADAKAKSGHRRDLNREAAEINRELAGSAFDPNLTFPR